MKKKKLYRLTIAVISLTTIFFVFNNKQVATHKEYASKINEYTNNIHQESLEKKTTKKGELPPNKYFERQHALEMNPKTGETHPENIEAFKNKKKSTVSFFKAPGETDELSWIERGPDNIGGRTRVVFYDPNDETGKRVFAGGVSGGLWVNNDITNENSLWSQVGIDENISVSCYAIDPNDSNIWYIGTGESYTANDGTGNGIWQTNDGGVTWGHGLSVDFESEAIGRIYYINQILAWNNQGTTELFFSIDGGLDYDFVGHGFTGWFKVVDGRLDFISFFTDSDDDKDNDTPYEFNTGDSPYVFSDIEVALDNSMWLATKDNTFGFGGGKIFRSTDGEIFEEKYSFTNSGRVELSISKQNANTVYAIAEIIDDGVELVRTTNGTDFSELAKPNDIDEDITENDFARGQAFYNLMLEADPNDDNILYTGGIDLFRSSDAGDSWDQISKWSNNNDLRNLNVSVVHADQHTLAFNPFNSTEGVFGNDGGIYYSENLLGLQSISNTPIESRNKNYNVTQFYSAAIGQDVNNDAFLAGAQDNGSLFISGATNGINSYSDLFGGDGAQVFIDKDNEYAIVSFVNNVYSLQPLPFTDVNNQIEIVEDEDTGDFINIADLDDNLDILFTNGSSNIGTSTANIEISRFSNLTFNPVRQNFSNRLLSSSPTTIKVSPFTTTSSTIIIGTEVGTLLKVTNFNTNNPTWNNIDSFEAINTGAISDIAFGDNEDEILVTLHNYGIDNIYYTSDGGVTWEVKDGDFVDIPTKAILMNPNNQNEVIIGTNFGVWRTENFLDITPNWVQSQNGMSNVKVTQFQMRTEDNTVLASTYGRGLFTGQFTEDEKTEDKGENAQDNFEIKSVISDNILDIKALIDINQVVELYIYKINGTLLLQETLDFNTQTTSTIDVNFQPGIYLVNLVYDDKYTTKKIIITN